jgi:hypothetical protein
MEVGNGSKRRKKIKQEEGRTKKVEVERMKERKTDRKRIV